MANSAILKGERFSEEKTTQIAEQFFRDGFVHIPGVLTEAEVTALREKSDETFRGSATHGKNEPKSRGC